LLGQAGGFEGLGSVGTKRVSRVEENTAADQLELSAEQIKRLNNLTPAAGERHEEAQMATIDR
jgi:diketogulonate reductase-like aldo/keto reductase